MRWTPVPRLALVPLLLLVLGSTACSGGGDGNSGPNDEDVFGTYTLVRANGEPVPAKVLESVLGGGGIVTNVEDGSFRISEDGSWAFAFHFEQLAIDDQDQLTRLEYDVEDAGTYSLQGESITLDGSTVVTLRNGVLTKTTVYTVPGAPVTTVAYEFEK
ncbi:MAG: hypothetical protein M3Q93_04605 [Gemmatimonadota bacterium]|nr:hypothetical protein [Gemmatimonadales bacterium]MDQ3136848.1 hypothetical protein [Gemmatimonadota bacterium]